MLLEAKRPTPWLIVSARDEQNIDTAVIGHTAQSKVVEQLKEKDSQSKFKNGAIVAAVFLFLKNSHVVGKVTALSSSFCLCILIRFPTRLLLD